MKLYSKLALGLCLSAFSIATANETLIPNPDMSHHSHSYSQHCSRTDVIVAIQQEFYKFQDATSYVKKHCSWP